LICRSEVASFKYTEACSAFGTPPDLLAADGFALPIVHLVDVVDLS
jgi:hypothetical protein